MRFPFAKNIKEEHFQISLLFLLVFAIFIIPNFSESLHDISYFFVYILILINSVFCLRSNRKRMFVYVSIALLSMLISRVFNMQILKIISSFVIAVFFSIVVGKILIQIARSKLVDEGVIMESISAYLLLGILYSLISEVILFYFSGSIVFPDTDILSTADFIYFTFVTMTTLGYGDVLPTLPIARSFAILVSISGQIYLTVIIAMLVGKYISQKQES